MSHVLNRVHFGTVGFPSWLGILLFPYEGLRRNKAFSDQCYELTITAVARRLRICAIWPCGPPIRSRERFLALHEIAEGGCATAVAERTGRRAQTVMEWLHAYNKHGPEALTYQRTGGRPPLSRDCRRAGRAGPCRPMPGGQSTGPRSGGKATLDAAAFGWLRAGAVWPPLLPRDHPPRTAPAQAVMEEGAQAARSRRAG